MTKYYFFPTLESKLLDHHHQHQMVRFDPEFDNEFNIYFKIDKLVNIAMHFCTRAHSQFVEEQSLTAKFLITRTRVTVILVLLCISCCTQKRRWS